MLNPIVQGQDLLRASLLPGLLRNIRENLKHYPSFRLFEIGREIHAQPQGLPDEIPHFAAVVFAKDDGAAGLFELKRLATILGPGITVQPDFQYVFRPSGGIADPRDVDGRRVRNAAIFGVRATIRY